MKRKYMQYMKSLDIGSVPYASARLCSTLKTSELVTRLKHRFCNDTVDERCKDPIDALYIHLTGKMGRFYYKFETLVMVYLPYDVRMRYHTYADLADRVMTFTNFKKSGISTWLQRCEEEPCKKIELTNGNTLKLWDTPYIIEASTDYDRDFRKEWRNGYLDFEGNEYGDTSTFYIVGCLEHVDGML